MKNKSEQIRDLYDAGKSTKEIKAKVNCSGALVAIVIRNYKKKLLKAKKAEQMYRHFPAKKSPKIIEAVKEMQQALDAIEKKPTRLFVQPEHRDAAMKILADNDLVNHPPHYKTGGVETIDFIEAKDLNYRLGNVVKYVSRAGKKGDPLQDLEKAAWYLQREITARKNA